MDYIINFFEESPHETFAIGVSVISLVGSIAFAVYGNKKANKANQIAEEANRKSEEANQLSSKSIAINYDAAFNDFNIQLRENIFKFMRFKEDFKKIRSQNKEYLYRATSSIIQEIIGIQSQVEYMRPSEYHDYYEELENLGESIKIKCGNLKKVAHESEEKDSFKIENFANNYNEALKDFDLIIERLETKIAK